MSFDLRSLYQETILDHGRNPRNFGVLEPHTHRGEGFNPLCGDQCTVTLRVTDGVVEAVRFEGHGCAISTASASLMTENVRGKSIDEVRTLFTVVREVITGEREATEDLGKLAVFEGVRQFPMRVKCATLAWHTLAVALDGSDEVASSDVE